MSYRQSSGGSVRGSAVRGSGGSARDSLSSRGSHGSARAPPPKAAAPAAEPLYPRMRVEEICEDMELFGQPITRDQLRKPDTDTVRSVFAFFIAKVYGKAEDDMLQPAFGCVDGLHYPELHDMSIPEAHFTAACQKMFADAQYTDNFELRDLYDPVSSRFMCQMSALVNCGKFREKRVREVVAMQEEALEVRGRVREYAEQCAEVEARIAAIERRREEDSEAAAAEQLLLDERNAKFSMLHQQHVENTQKTKDAKASLQATIDKITELNVTVMKHNQDIERMEGKVCSSPDRLQAEISDLLAAEEEGKVRVAEVMAQKHRLTKESLLLREQARAIESSANLAEEAHAALRRMVEVEAHVKERKESIRVLEAEKEKIDQSCALNENQFASVEARRERVRKQRDALGEDKHKDEIKITQLTREADREIEGVKGTIAEKKRRGAELFHEMHRLTGEFEKDVAVLEGELSVVEARLDSFKITDANNKDVDFANREALGELTNVIRGLPLSPARRQGK